MRGHVVGPFGVVIIRPIFTFHLLDPEGDGFTLTFQNTGQHALGADGAGLGYESILKSVAVKFDLYSDAGEGSNSTGIFTGGAAPTLPALDLTASGIDLHSGHLMHAWVEYDGTVLALTLMDTVTRTTATQTFPVNIPAAVGGSEAWVGFTAGTARLSEVQSILSWNYEYYVWDICWTDRNEDAKKPFDEYADRLAILFA